MVATVPAKHGRKPAAAATPTTRRVQSLTRSLKLLEWITESDGSVALTELAQQTGLPSSTTHRLLTTIQQQSFVRQMGELDHWAVGAHAFIVGSNLLQNRNLLAIVHPTLRKLMEDSGGTVNLVVLDHSDHQAIIVDQVQCTQLMRMPMPIGGKLPIHASGAGKAFLSQLSEEQVTGLLRRKGLYTYTRATLVSPMHLREDLARTRKHSCSLDGEGHVPDLRCVASCIYGKHHEPFAAISISGPISRITDDHVTEFGTMAIKAAGEVTLTYGGFRQNGVAGWQLRLTQPAIQGQGKFVGLISVAHQARRTLSDGGAGTSSGLWLAS